MKIKPIEKTVSIKAENKKNDNNKESNFLEQFKKAINERNNKTNK